MRLRSLILMVLLFAILSLPLLAAGTEEEKELGFWVEAQVLSRKQPSRVILWYEKDLTDSFGFFAFAWKESDGYREVLAGPTWKPFKELQIGFGIGREIVPGEDRGSRRLFFFDATKGDFNLYGAFENGRVSGPGHKVTATYALNERLGIGAMTEKGLGLGPRLEYNVKKNVQIWGAALRGRVPNADDVLEKKTTVLLGVNYSF